MAIPTYPTTDSTTGKVLPNPSRPITYGVKTNSIIFEADNGYGKRRPRGKAKNTFEFTYLVLNSTQYKTIRDFYIARKGPVESFYWTDPVTKTEYYVRFNMDTFVGEYKYHNTKTPLYEVAIKLEEVF